MGILASIGLKTYKAKWEEVSRGQFDDDDLAIIVSIKVVPSEYGCSGKIDWISGESSYMPLSRECRDVAINEELDPKECWVVTLERAGETTHKLLVK